MVKLEGVTKRFGSVWALRGVDFEINKGEVVGFLGPNGAGKTTAMRIITGYTFPTDGDVWVGGISVLEESGKTRQMVGYLPENPPLYLEMTVEEYLRFVAQLKEVPAKEIKSRVEKVMEETGLLPRRKFIIKHLSKGYRQRVGIAQALVNSPEVLILDEPTVGLDPIQVVEIRNLIKNLGEHQNRTIILSTHILPEVEQVCGRVIIINDGLIAAESKVEGGDIKDVKVRGGWNIDITPVVQVKVASKAEQAEKIISEFSGVSKVQRTDGMITFVEEDESARPELVKKLVSAGVEVVELKQEKYTLEKLFLEVTAGEVKEWS